ncbi:MAG: hypothetical protein BWX86_02904 [Verrucomicrobia bacterium ADurb.Bin122]|nr:MAG: hypothetical protein BWX86_02904 [Verrucomicrobia bacterium ADurb.Bin122]
MRACSASQASRRPFSRVSSASTMPINRRSSAMTALLKALASSRAVFPAETIAVRALVIAIAALWHSSRPARLVTDVMPTVPASSSRRCASAAVDFSAMAARAGRVSAVDSIRFSPVKVCRRVFLHRRLWPPSTIRRVNAECCLSAPVRDLPTTPSTSRRHRLTRHCRQTRGLRQALVWRLPAQAWPESRRPAA